MSATILQEFLVRCGFQIDEASGKRFVDRLERIGKDVMGLGSTVAGTTAAVETMSRKFAESMEKLYYASQRTGASIESLRSMDQGAQRIGLSAGKTTEILKGMVSAMRLNPGMEALMRGQFQIKSSGTTMLFDFLDRMAKMPLMVSSQWASMFGMSADDLQQMIMFRKELREEDEKSNQRGKIFGVNQQWGDDFHKFMNDVRDMVESFDLLGTKFAHDFLPIADDVVKFLTQVAEWMAKADDATGGLVGKVTALVTALGAFKGVAAVAGRMMGLGGATSAAGAGAAAVAKRGLLARLGPIGFVTYLLTGNVDQSYAEGEDARMDAYNAIHGAGAANRGPGGGQGDMASGSDYMQRLEAQFGLPPGLLRSTMGVESHGRDNSVSPVGAQGPFQFMPDTAKQYGVSDPFNRQQAAGGAARYFQHLLSVFNGDLREAVAAYNTGEGNVLGAIARAKRTPGSDWLQYLSKETRDYVPKVLGGLGAGDYSLASAGRGFGGARAGSQMHFESNITVNGSTSPAATAKAVEGAQTRVWGNLTRHSMGAVDALN